MIEKEEEERGRKTPQLLRSFFHTGKKD